VAGAMDDRLRPHDPVACDPARAHVALPAVSPPPATRALAVVLVDPRVSTQRALASSTMPWRNDWSLLDARPDAARRPGALGHPDLCDAASRATLLSLAERHGIGALCVRVGAVSGALVGDDLVERLLAEAGRRVRIGVAWANDAWRGRAPARPEHDAMLLARLLGRLADSQAALRVEDRLLVVVEHPEPDCIARLRAACGSVGIAMPFVVARDGQGTLRDAAEIQADALLDLPWPPERLPGAAGFDLAALAAKTLATAGAGRIPGVVAGWDDRPRRGSSGAWAADADVDVYAAWLKAAVVRAEAQPVAGRPIVVIHGWNGWADGACLEPDLDGGYAWLHATRAALYRSTPWPKVALLSHDARAHGAQYLALNIVREWLALGVDVEVVLQDGGWLRPRFEALAATHCLAGLDDAGIASVARDLRARGVEVLFANTAVAGRTVRAFKDAGLRIIGLVHELPGLLAYYELQSALQALVEVSECVLVAWRVVQDGLEKILPRHDLCHVIRRPQGLYTRNRYRDCPVESAPRVALRDRLGIAHHAAVVVTVGYADARKGADLWARVAAIACQRRSDLRFVWVGHRDPSLAPILDALLHDAGVADRVHFLGVDFDTDDIYAGADAYALTSREDPFPSVVLESLAVGTPVVAFRDTGGGAELLGEAGGLLAPAFDVMAYADALLALVNDPARRAALGSAGRARIERDHGFRDYALDLLALAGGECPRVDAVVPNYNHARYLADRVASIEAQTHPVSRLILLDDASEDASAGVLQIIGQYCNPAPLLVRRRENSGSPFLQWREGVRRAQGEFVWIAEADDVAEPELLELLVGEMRRDSGIVLAYAQSCRIDGDGGVLAPDYLGWTDDLDRERWRAPYTVQGQVEIARALAVKNTIPNVSAVLFRRDALEAVLEDHIDNIARLRVAGDWATYLHLACLGRIHFQPRVGNRHRHHARTVTSRVDAQRHYDEVVAMQALASTLVPLGKDVRARAEAHLAWLRDHLRLGES